MIRVILAVVYEYLNIDIISAFSDSEIKKSQILNHGNISCHALHQVYIF